MSTRRRSGGRVANSLIALSSAAVMAVYSAGYVRTKAAADKLRSADRPRIVIPDVPSTGAPADARPAGSSTPTPSASPVAAKPVAAAKAAARVIDSPSPSPTPSPSLAAVDDANAVAASPTPTPSASPAPSASPTPTPAVVYKDGTFSGWGTSRHGDIEATVVIEHGRIVSAVISQCWTRYSCSWVAHLQGQVVTRQSPDVDYVTGATQSTNAFYYAVVQALSKAK